MITPEALLKAGWIKAGNAWYYNGDQKHLTNFDDKWQLWKGGVQYPVTQMTEL